jgi:hypothetical protein
MVPAEPLDPQERPREQLETQVQPALWAQLEIQVQPAQLVLV